MKMSCNGCRVLRKGCSENCTLRTCILWITSPQSQANATLFLSKFYGRAGLLHLLNSGPAHLRPEIFKSLLYEACGRIINPISGSAGLISSDDWPRCHAAVDAVLRGAPLMKQVIADDGDHDDDVKGESPVQPFQSCDIRHVSKVAAESLRRIRARNRFKRSKDHADSLPAVYWIEPEAKFSITGWEYTDETEKNPGGDDRKSCRALSNDSVSVETAEPSLVMEPELEPCRRCEIGLELTLGLDPVRRSLSGISCNEER